jgi:hypothetical protein
MIKFIKSLFGFGGSDNTDMSDIAIAQREEPKAEESAPVAKKAPAKKPAAKKKAPAKKPAGTTAPKKRGRPKKTQS